MHTKEHAWSRITPPPIPPRCRKSGDNTAPMHRRPLRCTVQQPRLSGYKKNEKTQQKCQKGKPMCQDTTVADWYGEFWGPRGCYIFLNNIFNLKGNSVLCTLKNSVALFWAWWINIHTYIHTYVHTYIRETVGTLNCWYPFTFVNSEIKKWIIYFLHLMRYIYT